MTEIFNVAVISPRINPLTIILLISLEFVNLALVPLFFCALEVSVFFLDY